MNHRVASNQAMMQARLDADPTDSRAVAFFARSQKIQAYRDRKATESTVQPSVPSDVPERTAMRQRIMDTASRQMMAYQTTHIRGCTSDGCDLAPSDTHEPLLCLFEHDHVSRESKTASVTALRGNARSIEQAKTQVLCLWHHFTKTRAERGDGSVDTRRHLPHRELGQLKLKTGCQHPLHSSMAYAALIPSTTADPLMTGFLHVSHIVRGTTVRGRIRSGNPHQQKLDDVANGIAVIHCGMCHKLYTLCENAMLSDAPYVQHRYSRLLRQYPAFVQHFDQATAGVDWADARKRTRARCVAEAAKRKASRC